MTYRRLPDDAQTHLVLNARLQARLLCERLLGAGLLLDDADGAVLVRLERLLQLPANSTQPS